MAEARATARGTHKSQQLLLLSLFILNPSPHHHPRI